MSSKKRSSSGSAKSAAAAKRPSAGAGAGKAGGRTMSRATEPVAKPKRIGVWMGAAIAMVALVALIATSGGGSSGAGSSSGSGGGGWGKPAADADEARYIGRLLPAGYAEPKVSEAFAYSESTPMSDVAVTDDGAKVSIPLADVVSKRNVTFTYAGTSAKPLPMIAYVKPSGALFVAVSFCPPCEGERQRIEPDSTLTCESCGTRRDLESGVGLSGACKLYPLDEVPAKVVGDRIVVDKAVLDGWTPQPLDRKVG